MNPVSKSRNSRKGSLNRSSTTVRLAFHRMKYDAVVEWVKAIKQLEEQLDSVPNDLIERQSLRFSIIKEKLTRLEKAMEFIYPKIQGTDLVLTDLIEMEEELKVINGPEALPVYDRSTEDLLKELDGETIDVESSKR